MAIEGVWMDLGALYYVVRFEAKLVCVSDAPNRVSNPLLWTLLMRQGHKRRCERSFFLMLLVLGSEDSTIEDLIYEDSRVDHLTFLRTVHS